MVNCKQSPFIDNNLQSEIKSTVSQMRKLVKGRTKVDIIMQMGVPLLPYPLMLVQEKGPECRAMCSPVNNRRQVQYIANNIAHIQVNIAHQPIAFLLRPQPVKLSAIVTSLKIYKLARHE